MHNAASYPFSAVDDLSQFFLWPLLTNRQRGEVLEITNRAERHHYFAQCFATNGYPLSAVESRKRIGALDLVASIAEYLATLDDTEPMRDWGSLTSREAALSELCRFLRFLRRTCQHKPRSGS